MTVFSFKSALIVSCLSIVLAIIALPAKAAGIILKLGVPADIPPYYTNDGNGIIPDIMRAALGPQGYEISLKPMGNIRIAMSLKNKIIDIAPFAVIDVPDAYKSVKYLTFLNVAITKKNKNIKISSIEDLAGLRIAAFQGAKSVFGDEYRTIAETKAKLYREISDQKNQMNVFWRENVDVVVLGKLIFDYRSFHIEGAKNTPEKVNYHKIFGKGTRFSAIFNDETVRDAFNTGFNNLEKSGKLDSIYSKYVRQ